MTTCGLIHSPAVGPSTWRWVAESLRAFGSEVVVPDLRHAATTGSPAAFAAAASSALESTEGVVLVGHSGAGPLLPVIAASLRSAAQLAVFVDAGVPPRDGAFRVDGRFLEVLRAVSVDGVLPVWSEWWGEDKGVLETLVPDEQQRHAVEKELLRVPLAFYEASIEMPPDWCANPCAYLLLSEAYRPDATEAASRGWPLAERLGGHLDIVTEPSAVAEILLGLVRS